MSAPSLATTFSMSPAPPRTSSGGMPSATASPGTARTATTSVRMRGSRAMARMKRAASSVAPRMTALWQGGTRRAMAISRWKAAARSTSTRAVTVTNETRTAPFEI